MEVAKRQYLRLQRYMVENRKPTAAFIALVAISSYLISITGILPGHYRAETERCMDSLGCFAIDGDYSLRPFNVLPQHRSAIGTKFVLYNPNGTLSEYSSGESAALLSQLDAKKRLVIVIHGWISSRDNPVLKPMMEALVQEKSSLVNILLVEWKDGAAQTYMQAVANTRVVGAEIAQLLRYLQGTVALGDVHLVGSSLGAHIAGTCGALLPGIGRITALDAAGPLFENYPESIRLDPSDAIFVDAIHTDGDDFYKVVMVEGGLGIHHSIGHADFYPNGGHSQPHCTGLLTVQPLHKMVACDHELSMDYFAQSLRAKNSYVAYACQEDQQGFVDGICHSINYMGWDAVKPSHRTNYYLQMSDVHPFEGDHYVVNMTIQSVGLVCLQLTLLGENGRASQVEQPGMRKSCSSSSSKTAMLFASQSIGDVKSMLIVWEDESEPRTQMLTRNNTQIVLVNASVTYYHERYHLCEVTPLEIFQLVSVQLSSQPCT
ncbi:pancreatic triacylglycerol lipase-like isoform X2 [Watersipora subatra]|uniref:pancreatic triacylglycerol lipase-like isoform X2 n=1 Tax=Watersipora subatra TaxID=2589382 RepID=UPI00355C608F